MMEKIADLHTHTYYSDGTMTPQEILDEAIKKNVGLLAITDHNTLKGAIELKEISKNYDIKCISGVELDSLDNGVDYHILAYDIDLENKEFLEFVDKNRILLEMVDKKLIEKMEKDYDNITMEDYLNFSYDRRKGGWEAIHYFLHKGVTKELLEGFDVFRKYNHSYNCVDFPSVKTVCEYIHKAGGKAILAHPGKVVKAKDIDEFKSEVLRIMDMGLDGIECYYPLHSEEITKVCLDICKEKGLMITVGSDCHGSYQSTEIGEMKIGLSNLNISFLK